MDGFNIIQINDDSHNKGENEISCLPTQTEVQHRRSRSASEKNLEVSRDGILSSAKKGHNGKQQMPSLQTRAYSTRSPHRYCPSTNNNTSSNHRAFLEKDQEKSMCMMLERAMGRASSTLSP